MRCFSIKHCHLAVILPLINKSLSSLLHSLNCLRSCNPTCRNSGASNLSPAFRSRSNSSSMCGCIHFTHLR
ncbi:hypothetical protein PR003_g13490 [Phytophthora rubi]|uniref:Secreted protein n=1 Tax=Phytophthora rubi TaxID=129364 RepID=A0A6A4FF68_9STRA|nr:hypothetical protein PR002_g15000 [Phytophthora rubi]KAE9028586.1 hypothetical protein PR001_g11705 [Phytophthora rubi]KAE9334501.1 hypothetical protein PR003_g13490 [Phytophthora rubi]